MGNTSECVVVGGLTQQQVIHHLQSVQDVRFQPYAVGPQVADMVGIVSEGAGSWSIMEELSKLTSQPVLLYGIYDSDVFYYQICQQGQEIAAYNSHPEFGSSESVEEDEGDLAPQNADPRFDLLHCFFGRPHTTLQQIEDLINNNHPNSALSGLWLYDGLFPLLQVPHYVQSLNYEELLEGCFPEHTTAEDFVMVTPGV